MYSTYTGGTAMGCIAALFLRLATSLISIFVHIFTHTYIYTHINIDVCLNKYIHRRHGTGMHRGFISQSCYAWLPRMGQATPLGGGGGGLKNTGGGGGERGEKGECKRGRR